MTRRDWSKFPVGKPIIFKGWGGFWYVKRNGSTKDLLNKADRWADAQNHKIEGERREQRTYS